MITTPPTTEREDFTLPEVKHVLPLLLLIENRLQRFCATYYFLGDLRERMGGSNPLSLLLFS